LAASAIEGCELAGYRGERVLARPLPADPGRSGGPARGPCDGAPDGVGAYRARPRIHSRICSASGQP
jgi:hypothetical protein